LRRPAILSGLILSAGCGHSDPASSRLPAQSVAVVRPAGWADATKKPPRLQTPLRDVPGLDFSPYIAAGTQVRVVADEAPTFMNRISPFEIKVENPLIDGDGECDRRPVQVLVLDGDEEGRPGFLTRNELRPAP
jgi:hypothetical protein